jgi:hypothetical protein
MANRPRGTPQPALHGRRLTEDELVRHVPEKLEFVDGGLPRAEELLMLLLTQLGLREAALIVGEDAWRAAVSQPPFERGTGRK